MAVVPPPDATAIDEAGVASANPRKIPTLTSKTMEENNGALWDRKYAEGLPSLTNPDPFFLSTYGRFVAPRFPRAGTGLDLAGGLGRHALWLAARKWKMSLVDVSDVAVG